MRQLDQCLEENTIGVSCCTLASVDSPTTTTTAATTTLTTTSPPRTSPSATSRPTTRSTSVEPPSTRLTTTTRSTTRSKTLLTTRSVSSTTSFGGISDPRLDDFAVAPLIEVPRRVRLGRSVNPLDFIATESETGCVKAEFDNEGYYFVPVRQNELGVKFEQCEIGGRCKCLSMRTCVEGETDCWTPYTCDDTDNENRCMQVSPRGGGSLLRSD